MNPLDEYPQIRKPLYALQWLVNGILVIAGAVFVVNGTSTEDLPQWYVLTLAIGPVLWAYLGITAQTNTTTPPAGDRGAFTIDDAVKLALLVLVVVVVVLLVTSAIDIRVR